MADPSVADLTRSFELHRRAEKKAGRTIERYLDALRLAARFLTTRGVDLETESNKSRCSTGPSRPREPGGRGPG